MRLRGQLLITQSIKDKKKERVTIFELYQNLIYSRKSVQLSVFHQNFMWKDYSLFLTIKFTKKCTCISYAIKIKLALSELHEFIFFSCNSCKSFTTMNFKWNSWKVYTCTCTIVWILTWRKEQFSWPVFQPFWILESTAWLQQWAVCQVWSWPNFWTTSSGYLVDWIAQHIQDSWWWIPPCLDSPSPVFQSVQLTWNLSIKSQNGEHLYFIHIFWLDFSVKVIFGKIVLFHL